MEYRKNDIVTLEIVDCGTDGEGIGKADGFTVFVKDAVIGDTVTAKIMKAKKNYGYARLMRIVKESAFRVSARCPEARRCGGCQIQEMDYRKQLEFKNTKVRNNLIRLGSVEEELLDQGIKPNTIRLSIGTEHIDDIIQDLDEAFKAVE